MVTSNGDIEPSNDTNTTNINNNNNTTDDNNTLNNMNTLDSDANINISDVSIGNAKTSNDGKTSLHTVTTYFNDGSTSTASVPTLDRLPEGYFQDTSDSETDTAVNDFQIKRFPLRKDH